jgi:large subunit ribosomal protein L10
MSRNIKRLMIDSIQEAISGVKDFLIVDVSRVTGMSVNRIRLDLADRGISFLCVKNAVASRALSDLGLGCASEALVGPSALVYGAEDIVAVSKEIVKYADSDKTFVVRSGIVDGRLLSSDDISVLSKSPGKPELLSQLSAYILSPGRTLTSQLSSCGVVVGQIDRLSEEK